MQQSAVAGAGSAPVAPASGGVVPFFYGSNQYVEKNDFSSALLGTAAVEVAHNIKPGGFLRGVRLQIRSTGGVLGTGAVSADGPWTALQSVSLENIDGGPIRYPMSPFAYSIANWFTRPWHGDPNRRWDFANTINPSASLWVQPEIRHTAGVLANTDARSLFRIRYVFNTLAGFLGTVGTATAPTVTVTEYMEAWAQPDKEDLNGRPIEELPPGLNLQTLMRHQVVGLMTAGSDNTIQFSNTGNEIRALIWIMRNSSNVRTDLASDPIRWRLDTRSMGTYSPDELFNTMSDRYESLQNGSTRPLGVYVFNRFFDPGRMVGQAWMTTNNATYNVWETATGTGGTNGTLEIISDEVVPLGAIPMELESI